MTYLTYLNYVTSAGNSDGEPVASHFVHRSELRLSKKNILKSADNNKEFINFGVPHNQTYYATRSVLHFNNFLQDKAGGATCSVWLCGNSQNPGCLIVSPQKSYHR